MFLQTVNYPPVLCKGKECGAALNPFASIDYATKMWICPLCSSRNYFPSYYSDISPEHSPAELFDSSTTIEYILNSQSDEPHLPPVYIFIVDTALSEDELDACKSTLEQALQMMPEDCLIGAVPVLQCDMSALCCRRAVQLEYVPSENSGASCSVPQHSMVPH